MRFWIISHRNTSFLNNHINNIKFSEKLAAGSDCIPMGAGVVSIYIDDLVKLGCDFVKSCKL